MTGHFIKLNPRNAASLEHVLKFLVSVQPQRDSQMSDTFSDQRAQKSADLA